MKDGFGAEAGVWFRLALGGITGHKDFARDTGVIVKPEEATQVADAVVRVYIEHGDRTDRTKARLKYVLDAWGWRNSSPMSRKSSAGRLIKVPAEAIAPRPAYRPRRAYRRPQAEAAGLELDRRGAAGRAAHRRPDARPGEDRQRFRRRRYPPHGLAESADLRRARRQGRARAEAAIAAIGLSTKATSIRAGLIACTGNVGCRFAASDTKRHAEEIAHWCEARVDLDGPVNIHLTGCHHSCAQHYIGEIGLLACKVEVSEDDDRRGLSHLCRRRLRTGCRARPRNLSRREGRPTRRASSSACSRAIWRIALRATRRFSPFRAATRSTRSRRCSRRRRPNEPEPAAADPLAGAGHRAVLRRAARLAQRLLRRPGFARRHRHHAAVATSRRRRCSPARFRRQECRR